MIELPIVLQTRDDLDFILTEAVKLGVSDIHLSTDLPLSMRLHGLIEQMSHRTLSFAEVSNLLVASKDENTSCLSIINSGEDIDYSYVCKSLHNKRQLRFRVNASSKQVAGKLGLSIVFRVINPDPPDLDDLGVEPEIANLTTQLHKGLAIVAGATGSGKSTLLASINRRRLEQRQEVIITHESPIEYVYDKIKTKCVINQREIGASGNYKTFYQALVGSLRQDPDVILVGEARDRETINAAIHGVQTGHALFTTVHTQGVAQTINRLVKEFGAHEREAKLMDIIDSLAIIIYQTLVPSTDGKRVALKEYLIFDGEVKDSLRESAINQLYINTVNALIEKGQTLLMDAEKKFAEKRIDEVTYKRIKKQFEAEVSQARLSASKQENMK